MGLRSLACCECGFESRRVRGCLSVVSVVCVFRYRSLRRADHSSRGVLPSAVCLSVIEEPYRGSLGLLGLLSHEKKKQSLHICNILYYIFISSYTSSGLLNLKKSNAHLISHCGNESAMRRRWRKNTGGR